MLEDESCWEFQLTLSYSLLIEDAWGQETQHPGGNSGWMDMNWKLIWINSLLKDNFYDFHSFRREQPELMFNRMKSPYPKITELKNQLLCVCLPPFSPTWKVRFHFNFCKQSRQPPSLTKYYHMLNWFFHFFQSWLKDFSHYFIYSLK